MVYGNSTTIGVFRSNSGLVSFLNCCLCRCWARSWTKSLRYSRRRISIKSFLSPGYKCFHYCGRNNVIHQHFPHCLLPKKTLQETIKLRWDTLTHCLKFFPVLQRFQFSQMLDGKPDASKIIIISVSIIGTVLLLLNILVVSFFIYKKNYNVKEKEDGKTNLLWLIY